MTPEYVPSPWEFFLLSVAAFRVWRLLAEDDILDGPRMWLLRLPRDWKDGDAIPSIYRDKCATFLTCPWCLGLWVFLGFYLFWCNYSEWALRVAAVGAGSAVLGLIRKNLDDS